MGYRPKSNTRSKIMASKAQIQAWLNRNRPGVVASQEGKAKGFYRRDAGKAASFKSLGTTWAEVARHFGIK
jgi:hypothetical protein